MAIDRDRHACYMRLRRQGHPARSAYLWTKGGDERPEIDWDTWDRQYVATASVQYRSFHVSLAVVVDDDFNHLEYGKWSNRWEPGAIKNHGHDVRGEYEWFIPAESFESVRDGFRDLGKHASWCRAREMQREAMKWAAGGDNIQCYYVTATAYADEEREDELGQGSCGGITFDGDDPWDECAPHLTEVAWECIDDAVAQAERATRRTAALREEALAIVREELGWGAHEDGDEGRLAS